MTAPRAPERPTLYKVLAEHGAAHHGGTGVWFLPHGKRAAKWMPLIAKIEPCRRGYHLCDGATDLIHWLGPCIYTAESRGERIRHEDKIVVSEARLIARCEHWNERTARLFAASCAWDVLPIFERERPGDDRPRKAIEAARLYARGEIGAAARAAAGDAARDAARAAAGDAARAAAWAAARDAAGDAARDAAGDAAWDAAWDAARDAARANFNDLIYECFEDVLL